MQYGVRWQEFSRDGSLVAYEEVFATETAQISFIENLIHAANFYDFVMFDH
jgi:hypothetical protein